VKHFDRHDHLHYYGSEAYDIQEMIRKDDSLGAKIMDEYAYVKAEVIWAVRHEMARTVEDFLARRIRLLFLDARASIKAAPVVARLMAGELKKDKKWISNQLEAYKSLAKEYILE